MKIETRNQVATDLDCLDVGTLFKFVSGGGLCMVTDRDCGQFVSYVKLVSGHDKEGQPGEQVVVFEGTLTAIPKIS